MEMKGYRGHDKYLPHLLGHEGSGNVIEVGNKVTKVSPGDNVILTWIKGKGIDCRGPIFKYGENIINAGPITTFSEYTIISENRCVKLPEGIPMNLASILGCAILTGAGMVFNTLQPRNSENILIYGLGGIGLSALMAANIAGCRQIIAVDINENKLNLSIEFGATHTINPQKDNISKIIDEITNGLGVDYAVESAGLTSTIEDAFNLVRDNGGHCIFASHPKAGEKFCLDPFKLICGKNISGSWGGNSQPDSDIPKFVRYFIKGELPLEKLTDRYYPLEKINQALDDLDCGKVSRPIIEM